MASQGVSKDEHKQESVTVAPAPDTAKCAVTNFFAGNIAHHISDWGSITSEPSILKIVTGYCIDFVRLPYQSLVPNVKFSKGVEHIIEIEVKKPLEGGNTTQHTAMGNSFLRFLLDRRKMGLKGSSSILKILMSLLLISILKWNLLSQLLSY